MKTAAYAYQTVGLPFFHERNTSLPSVASTNIYCIYSYASPVSLSFPASCTSNSHTIFKSLHHRYCPPFSPASCMILHVSRYRKAPRYLRISSIRSARSYQDPADLRLRPAQKRNIAARHPVSLFSKNKEFFILLA